MRWWRGGVAVFLVLTGAARMAPATEVAGEPATILIEAVTGETLSEHGADAPRPLGTLSQLMVLLLSLEEARLGALRLEVPVTVSDTAVRTDLAATGSGATRIPLRADKVYLLSDLLKAVLVGSAGDAAVAAAEAIAGSVPACLDLMNARAQRLGMNATHFCSMGGIPTTGPTETDRTSARDLARLARMLVQHPEVVQWASLSGLPFDQGTALLRNVNQLIAAVPGADGLQVSNSRPGGFSIVATAQRGGLRLIAVVLGAKDSAARYRTAADLLEWGFAHYERLEILKQGESVALPIGVADGSVSELRPVFGQSVSLLRRRDEERDLQLHYQLPAILAAPIQRHQQVGEVIVEERGELIAVVPVLSPVNVPTTSILSAALHDR